MIGEPAVYKKVTLPEYQGNPLIEALPPKVSDEELVFRLGFYPPNDNSIRDLEGIDRLEYLVRLDQLRQPLPEYIWCFRMVESAIKASYSAKNPFSPTTTYYLSYLSHSLPSVIPNSGAFTPKGEAMTVVGISGVGKTKMLERILQYFPQVIDHQKYEGNPLILQQLNWIKIECPHDSSLRGLCHTILGQIDVALGRMHTTPERNIDTLLDQIERVVKSSFVGIIVIDEMQNLNVAKAGGADKLLSFLLNLINRCGVPILFCGNPQVSDIFKRTFRNARRAESGGYIEMDRLTKDDVWQYFVEQLWALQFTKTHTPLTPDLDSKLYDLSTGILDIAVRIYKKSQELVIDTGDERITVDLLDEAYHSVCKLTDSGLDLLRRQKSSGAAGKKAIRDSYDDLVIDDTPPLPINDNKVQKSKSVIVDLTRAQHPEFAEKIRGLQLEVDLRSKIDDPDLFQRAAKANNMLQHLRNANILCDDPLTQLS